MTPKNFLPLLSPILQHLLGSVGGCGCLLVVLFHLYNRIVILRQQHHLRIVRGDTPQKPQSAPLRPPPPRRAHEPIHNFRPDGTTELPSQPASCDADSEGPTCYICFEAGPDESGQPLRRDCSCRGDSAGFAHLSCIVGYAERMSQKLYDDGNMNKFSVPWNCCTCCHQEYQNELIADLADQFMRFVEKKYPGDRTCKLDALYLKVFILCDKKKWKEAEEVSKQILSIIEEMKAEAPSLPRKIQLIEANNYINIGRILVFEGTKESAKAAVVNFEKCRDIYKAVGLTDGVLYAEAEIAEVKSKYAGCKVNDAKVLEKQRELYKFYVEKYGQEAAVTIQSGMALAKVLRNENHTIDAERLLTKLLPITKRVHGPGHNDTQQVESALQHLKVRKVTIEVEGEQTYFQALRYEEHGMKCVIQGPVTEPRNIQEETEATVTSDDFSFLLGTPITCHGLDDSPELNGRVGDLRAWDNETDSYRVHFEDNTLEPSWVKRRNLLICFELPDE
mmetsp:Transcript_35790/g.86395  ORF Transcript_35790/g.86395 Transcript_35790/m.86395 type:complete len:505 (-) Transcript_35790:294-1808(-)